MADRTLLPGEHATLGLLGLRAMHGYEMARLFADDDLVSVCPIEQSLLYTYLRNLEERGMVRWDERRVGNRPPRKLYELTPLGRDELARWLKLPVGRIREIRIDFLLKLYFLHQTDRAAERTLLADQIRVCERYEADLSRGLTTRTDFPRLIARSKLSAAAATLSWLREYARELEITPGDDAVHAQALP